MAVFDVIIEESRRKKVTIAAEDERDAERKIRQRYLTNELTLKKDDVDLKRLMVYDRHKQYYHDWKEF